jgi:DNA-binding CsgD family transcriptional regulator
MPLQASALDAPGVALLVAGRQEVSEILSVQGYARSHGLTSTECQVMRLVCGGSPAQEIARRQGVAVSTIRSQIGSIRAKIGVRNIGALVQQVALLPPMPTLLAQETAGARP